MLEALKGRLSWVSLYSIPARGHPIQGSQISTESQACKGLPAGRMDRKET